MTAAFYRTVGVLGGRNGPGTAFFINQQGLLATTRFVVGGLTRVTIALESAQMIPGQVLGVDAGWSVS